MASDALLWSSQNVMHQKSTLFAFQYVASFVAFSCCSCVQCLHHLRQSSLLAGCQGDSLTFSRMNSSTNASYKWLWTVIIIHQFIHPNWNRFGSLCRAPVSPRMFAANHSCDNIHAQWIISRAWMHTMAGFCHLFAPGYKSTNAFANIRGMQVM